MGKRSKFERRERDYYPTPQKAVEPLLKHVSKGVRFYEPCAGDGRLISHLEKAGMVCMGACDIVPQADNIDTMSAFDLNSQHVEHCDSIITNPPWDRKILHPMILHFITLRRPTWLIFDADWMQTGQATDIIYNYCTRIVAIGRVSWMDNGKGGKDNAAWYRFENKILKCPPLFYPKHKGA